MRKVLVTVSTGISTYRCLEAAREDRSQSPRVLDLMWVEALKTDGLRVADTDLSLTVCRKLAVVVLHLEAGLAFGVGRKLRRADFHLGFELVTMDHT